MTKDKTIEQVKSEWTPDAIGIAIKNTNWKIGSLVYDELCKYRGVNHEQFSAEVINHFIQAAHDYLAKAGPEFDEEAVEFHKIADKRLKNIPFDATLISFITDELFFAAQDAARHQFDQLKAMIAARDEKIRSTEDQNQRLRVMADLETVKELRKQLAERDQRIKELEAENLKYANLVLIVDARVEELEEKLK